MLYLLNLRSQSVQRGLPWEFTSRHAVPKHCLTDKKAREKWSTDPATQYQYYSMVEGVNDVMRVNRDDGDNGNPPAKMYGFVLDIDIPLTEAEIQEAIKRMGALGPNWIEKSLSGNWRFIWLFETPIPLPSCGFTLHLLKHIDEFLPIRKVAGIDEGALRSPERYYANGGDWRQVKKQPLSTDRVQGWVVGISAKFDWHDCAEGVEIPADVLSPALRAKYPRFDEWEGDFALNAQGPTFWVEGSTSPKSAIVRVTGMQTFAAHATHAFYTWSELLGAEFVRGYRQVNMGQAVSGIYFDGNRYWRQLPNGEWRSYKKDDTKDYLCTTRNLSDRRLKGEISSLLDHAIQYIQNYNAIKGAASFCFHPPGILHFNGHDYLNTHAGSVLAPAKGSAAWGPKGQFPFISKFVDGLFSPVEQREYFLSWLSHFYRSCFNRDPRSGQAIFLCGPPGVGKTFLSAVIVSPLFGGSADARDHLMGDDKFGSENFEKAVWTVDDGSIASDPKAKRIYTEIVKRSVANHIHKSHEKFQIPCRVLWQGRIIITFNADAVSVQMLPELENSILDKLMLFRTSDKPAVEFKDQGAMKTIVEGELSYFARYLLDYQIPEQCVGEARFGVRAYAEPSLVQTANASSSTAAFMDILDAWAQHFFIELSPGARHWEGTAHELCMAIIAASGCSHLDPMRDYPPKRIAQLLPSFKERGQLQMEITNGRVRKYKIYRDLGRFPLSSEPETPKFPVTPATPGSRFQKPADTVKPEEQVPPKGQ